MKAIFLDRDGTLIVDKHYVFKIEDLEYFPDTKEALQIMQNKGFELFIVTNQSGVARGYYQSRDVETFHQHMQNDMKRWGLKPYVETVFCPDHPDSGSFNRKPNPGMLLSLIQKWKIDPSKSYMVGDRRLDVECGERAQVKGIMVRNHEEGLTSFNSLLEFAQKL